MTASPRLLLINPPLLCLFGLPPPRSYEMTKDELLAKISLVDAIVIRSATKASRACCCLLCPEPQFSPTHPKPNISQRAAQRSRA